jgi:mRNA-degrading endonuclease RelE of RelBE toxin-antitoxin system
MVEVIFEDRFKEIFQKVDSFMKEKILKQIKKLRENPEVGKPMRHDRKGTRELYIKPFRLSYAFFKEKNLIYILDLYHKKEQ